MDVAIGYHRSAAAGAPDRARAREPRRPRGRLPRRPGRRRPRRRRSCAQAVRRWAASTCSSTARPSSSARRSRRRPPPSTTVSSNVNLRSVVLLLPGSGRESCAPGGHIVNIGDVGATRAWPGYIPYTVVEGGRAALTRGLAVALRARGIAVNCVAPGTVLRPPGFSHARWKARDARPRGPPRGRRASRPVLRDLPVLRHRSGAERRRRRDFVIRQDAQRLRPASGYRGTSHRPQGSPRATANRMNGFWRFSSPIVEEGPP